MTVVDFANFLKGVTSLKLLIEGESLKFEMGHGWIALAAWLLYHNKDLLV